MEIISGDSANLKTVSQAEAEAVQALLVSDAHNSATMPMARRGSRSSLPYIETRKAPVSEDLVSLFIGTLRRLHGHWVSYIGQARGIHVSDGSFDKEEYTSFAYAWLEAVSDASSIFT